MNVLDLFFKKFSYKFPKGYPDMKNEQDILLLESLVSKILGEEIVLEKKLEWKDLSDETRKYYRLEVIADKIANEGPFKLENGKEEVLKFDKDSYADLFKAQNVNDINELDSILNLIFDGMNNNLKSSSKLIPILNKLKTKFK